MTTLYDTLGVGEDASEDEIKRAYRKKAQEHHPDKNSGEESETFLAVSEAYRVLSDKDKRRHYDETGHNPGAHAQASVVEQAKGRILGAVMQGVQQAPDMESVDFMKALREFFYRERKAVLDNISKIDEAREKLNEAAERFSCDEADNFISAALKAEGAKLVFQAAETKKALEVLDQVDSLLEHFGYDFTAMDNWTASTRSTGTTWFSRPIGA